MGLEVGGKDGGGGDEARRWRGERRGAVGLELEVQTSPSDVSQCGPTHQNGQRRSRSDMAPLVRVNGQTIDPTTSSAVTICEGFGQGSGEK